MAGINDRSTPGDGSGLRHPRSAVDKSRIDHPGNVGNRGCEAVEALDEFIVALRDARAEMRKTENFLLKIRQRVADGERVESLIVRQPPAVPRQALADALDKVIRSRHRVRQKVFALAIERGVSAADLSRAWGFSRQLAARYAKGDSSDASSPAEQSPT